MQKNKIGAAWLIALIATLLSLYSSEIAKMPVCTLCWWQRIFMFPLAIQLGIAFFRNDSSIKFYTLPIAILGALFALFHYLLQTIPSLILLAPCRADPCGVHCETIDWQLFGFITLPLLSLLAFLAITFLLFITKKSK